MKNSNTSGMGLDGGRIADGIPGGPDTMASAIALGRFERNPQRQPLARPTALSVADLPMKQTGCIAEVHGNRSFRRRLMELGLVPGSFVKVLNVAPLGDPLEIEVRNCRLSIRRDESKMLELTAPDQFSGTGCS